jgi:hypothetical protein
LYSHTQTGEVLNKNKVIHSQISMENKTGNFIGQICKHKNIETFDWSNCKWKCCALHPVPSIMNGLRVNIGSILWSKHMVDYPYYGQVRKRFWIANSTLLLPNLWLFQRFMTPCRSVEQLVERIRMKRNQNTDECNIFGQITLRNGLDEVT